MIPDVRFKGSCYSKSMKALKWMALGLVVMVTFKSHAEAPEVGREAAARYFEPSAPPAESRSIGADDHYLALHLGRFMNGRSWDWGKEGPQDRVGTNTYGLTYRMSEWNNSMDWSLRVDFTEFQVDDEKPLKMTFLPLLTFPDATSKFPLYFGGGVGLGVFFKQIHSESNISLDYQMMVGARFLNIYENAGFFIETGLKNHLLLTSDGQFNGVYLSGGAVFTF